MSMASRSLALLVLGLSSTVMAIRSFAEKPDQLAYELEDDRNQWMSLDKETEFLQVDEEAIKKLGSVRKLESNPYATQAFADGEVVYDEYQQAWRYLGFMIDCDSSNDDDDGDGGGGSNDGGTGEGCTRFVVWAAYVDLRYEGGGTGEYQYWDTNKNKWDSSSCLYSDGSRCAKMDCHSKTTHFSLLGIFKHKSYDDWMEQLFKHEGYCVWTSSEYSFMDGARDAWPQGCTATYTITNDGDTIYYDLKPTSGSGMTIGLYTDTRCVEEYRRSGSSDPITVENIVGNVFAGGSGDGGYYDGENIDTFSKGLAAWESGFDKWRVCQPCVAYDITNVGYGTDDDASKGEGYWNYNSRYYDDDMSNGDYNDFDCSDVAGYTNVNQCMKFMAKTTMNGATYRDLSLAIQQGTTATFQLTGGDSNSYSSFGSESSSGTNTFLTIVFFACSCGLMLLGVNLYRIAKREAGFKASFSPKEPLVFA